MAARVVITGVGLVTPLGLDPGEILRRIEARETAAVPPTGFDPSPFACRLCAPVPDFQPQRFVPEPKLLRLMNRDAQLAVAAARLAVADAGLVVERDYAPEAIGLFGATGLAGLSLGDVAPLLRASAGSDGRFDPERFGTAGLKAISPLLSFKVLSNMPICFVSICERLQGPNAIYSPWEGHGAQAIEAGWCAVRNGEARCALVGGCDAKTHELAFVSLEQRGLFESWKHERQGLIPGEGAAFLVLEPESAAAARGAKAYARLVAGRFGTVAQGEDRLGVCSRLLGALGRITPAAVVSAAEGEASSRHSEAEALRRAGLEVPASIEPKPQLGTLFAAAAAVQVGVAALLAGRRAAGERVLANCFGHGSGQAAFLLETP